MTDELIPIAFAGTHPAAAEFQQAIVLPLTVDDTTARVKHCIEAEDLWVLHEVNPQMLLSRGGFAVAPVRQIFFFHPRLMIRVIGADRAALLEAPLKFAVLGLSEQQCELRWIDPALSFERYQSSALADLGQELSALQQRIARAVSA